MQHKVTIVHYYPIDAYPPATNFVKFLISKEQNPLVISTPHQNLAKNSFTTYKRPFFIKWLQVPFFCIQVLLSLIVKRPKTVIFYEVISSWAPIFYKKYFNKKALVYAHYHEFISFSELKFESRIVRWLKHFERRNIKLFDLISQTNEVRTQLFINEYPDINTDLMTLPNYPPISWSATKKINKNESNAKAKFVFLGATDLDTMYLKEICELLNQLSPNVSLDIFSFNINQKTLDFLENYNFIKFNGAINYDEVPNTLKQYDIGLILYKPNTKNFIHNATNKLFEYAVCGLDIWYPADMVYIEELKQSNHFFNGTSIDYSNPNLIDIKQILSNPETKRLPNPFSAENEFNKLYQKLKFS